MNMNKLRGKIVEKGMTQEAFASKLNMSTSKLYRLMNEGGVNFTAAEMDAAKETLGLSFSDLIEIFLP